MLANHKVTPPEYPHAINYEWQAPYRARRIEQLLGTEKHDLNSFQRMQADVVSLAARELLPHFNHPRLKIGTARCRASGRSRSSWPRGGANSPAPSIPTSWATL